MLNLNADDLGILLQFLQMDVSIEVRTKLVREVLEARGLTPEEDGRLAPGLGSALATADRGREFARLEFCRSLYGNSGLEAGQAPENGPRNDPRNDAADGPAADSASRSVPGSGFTWSAAARPVTPFLPGTIPPARAAGPNADRDTGRTDDPNAGRTAGPNGFHDGLRSDVGSGLPNGFPNSCHDAFDENSPAGRRCVRARRVREIEARRVEYRAGRKWARQADMQAPGTAGSIDAVRSGSAAVHAGRQAGSQPCARAAVQTGTQTGPGTGQGTGCAARAGTGSGRGSDPRGDADAGPRPKAMLDREIRALFARVASEMTASELTASGMAAFGMTASGMRDLGMTPSAGARPALPGLQAPAAAGSGRTEASTSPMSPPISAPERMALAIARIALCGPAPRGPRKLSPRLAAKKEFPAADRAARLACLTGLDAACIRAVCRRDPARGLFPEYLARDIQMLCTLPDRQFEDFAAGKTLSDVLLLLFLRCAGPPARLAARLEAGLSAGPAVQTADPAALGLAIGPTAQSALGLAVRPPLGCIAGLAARIPAPAGAFAKLFQGPESAKDRPSPPRGPPVSGERGTIRPQCRTGADGRHRAGCSLLPAETAPAAPPPLAKPRGTADPGDTAGPSGCFGSAFQGPACATRQTGRTGPQTSPAGRDRTAVRLFGRQRRHGGTHEHTDPEQ